MKKTFSGGETRFKKLPSCTSPEYVAGGREEGPECKTFCFPFQIADSALALKKSKRNLTIGHFVYFLSCKSL